MPFFLNQVPDQEPEPEPGAAPDQARTDRNAHHWEKRSSLSPPSGFLVRFLVVLPSKANRRSSGQEPEPEPEPEDAPGSPTAVRHCLSPSLRCPCTVFSVPLNAFQCLFAVVSVPLTVFSLHSDRSPRPVRRQSRGRRRAILRSIRSRREEARAATTTTAGEVGRGGRTRTAARFGRPRRSLSSVASPSKTLPLPRVSTADVVAKTVPLPRVATAFAAKTVPLPRVFPAFPSCVPLPSQLRQCFSLRSSGRCDSTPCARRPRRPRWCRYDKSTVFLACFHWLCLRPCLSLRSFRRTRCGSSSRPSHATRRRSAPSSAGSAQSR